MQALRLAETLSTINPDRLPVELPSSFLPETLEGDRVEDFNSAMARIESVEAEAEGSFEAVTSDYASQIAELKGLGGLDPETEGELRNLLVRREFTTLADWLNMLRTGGVRKPQLPGGIINKRLAWYRSVLPDLGTLDPNRVARAVDAGGNDRFPRLQRTGRRPARGGSEDPADISRTQALVKDTKASNAAQVRGKTMELASALLYDVVECKADEALSRVGQQIHVSTPRSHFLHLIPLRWCLPEFGSATQGTWRICVVARRSRSRG